MRKKLYLAYGSNMSEEQMAYRCPDAELIGRAVIQDYELLFKGSKTGSYATIERSKDNYVPVLVWEISERDERSLDLYEGYPKFYYKKQMIVEVKSFGSNGPIPSYGKHRAMVYIMDETRSLGIPSARYYDVLEEAYKKFGFAKSILEQGLAKSCNHIYGKQSSDKMK